MNTANRREFLKTGTQVCLGCCVMFATSNLKALNHLFPEGENIDPAKLNYCGYTCPEECEFKIASVKNDTELKKEAFTAWGIEERYGIKFEADKVFCFGCKNPDQPEGVVLTNCTVRSCTIDKGFDCCIECKDLPDCDKDLWSRFPKFKQQVVEMQKTYLNQ